MADEDDVDEFIEDYHKHLGEIDEIAQLVLSAHFEIDTALNDVLVLSVCHEEYLEKIRISFPDKIHIARALTPESHDHPHWQVILALNALRNQVAHRMEREKREQKIRELRAAMLPAAKPKLAETIKNVEDAKFISYAAAMGTGYLLHLLDEISKARGLRLEEGRNSK